METRQVELTDEDMRKDFPEIFEYIYTHKLTDTKGVHLLSKVDENDQPFSEEEMDKRRKIYDYRRRVRRQRGIFVAQKDEITEKFVIGFSLCDRSQDTYNPTFGHNVAEGRIDKLLDKIHEAELEEEISRIGFNHILSIPYSIREGYQEFVERCKRYFKVEPLVNFDEHIAAVLEHEKEGDDVEEEAEGSECGDGCGGCHKHENVD